MDTFVEQIVVKKKGTKDYAIIIGSILAAILVISIALPYILLLGMFSFLLLSGIGYGIWIFLTSLNVEFEYSVTNGDIDIDQIIARRKRKRVVSVIGDKIESLEPYKAEAYAARKFDRTVIAAPSVDAPELWCFTYRSKKNGHTLVVFQPERRVLEALKSGLSSLVLRETDKKSAQ